MTSTIARCLAAAAVLALGATPVCAAYYKWIDDQGTVHYTQTPPPDRPAQELHPALPPAPPAPARGTPAPASTARSEPEAGEQKAGASGEDDPEFRRKACAWAKSELAGAQRANRVFRTDAEGNRVRLSEEERQARIAELRSKVDEYCR